MKYPQTVEIGEQPIAIYYHSLLIFVGPAGCGKSTLAKRHFSRYTRVSTDECRAMISNSPLNQKVSDDAFGLFYTILEKRLKNGYPAIADSTALQRKYRKRLVEIAEKYRYATVLVLFDLPWELCLKRDSQRRYTVGEKVLRHQFASLEKTKQQLEEEVYDRLIVCRTPRQLDQISFRFTDPSVEVADSGPFDIIGDVHGCHRELVKLLSTLGYELHRHGYYCHPQRRKAIFLGDICDRGPHNLQAFQLVYNMWKNGQALYTPGNHCDKLARYLRGNPVTVDNGLERTAAEIESQPPEEQQKFAAHFEELFAAAPPYLILDDGKLVVSHAGILGRWIGIVDKRVRSFCLYGDTTGAKDAKGHPVRRDWAVRYRGTPYIVYGHTPIERAVWRNRTINIDLGAVFGGKLCALRYPEKEIVEVAAEDCYDQWQ